MVARIGPSALLEETPCSVELHNEPYILSMNDDGDPVLHDAICPHEGGTVDVESDAYLRCPQHNWDFDPATGDSTNIPGEALRSYAVTVRDGELYADLPTDEGDAIEFSTEPTDERPEITLVSHAALLIEYDGFTLLTDPWIDGPAFLGAWTQYPPSPYDVEELAADVDAIWITHEHSDHLHPPTLSQFDHETPVYVPELNYQRLADRLSEVGLTNVYRLPTGTPYKLADNVEAVCFESGSTWNDSILLVDCGGFRILNVNDVGVNWDVQSHVESVDLVASGFAFGASGYPLTWNHLTDSEKESLVEDRNRGQLAKCKQLVDLFDPSYFLPFAKFFTLAQPDHERYRDRIAKNTPADVADYLADDPVRVLDMLPGERWNGDDTVTRLPDRERFFEDDVEASVARAAHEEFTPFVPRAFDLTHDELGAYFTGLAGSRLAGEIASHGLTLELTGADRSLSCYVTFEGGEIRYTPTETPVGHDESDTETHVTMRVPGHLVQHVVREDRSWDEIRIGYWSESSRDPDEYNLPFWRLLHAPWEARTDTYRIAESYDIETELGGRTMADLVEQAPVQETLERYGLFCAGCPAGLGEDILEAARIHGLDSDQARSLVSDIEAAVEDVPGATVSD
jgi:CMP-N-acetylneuraminate monooxygenase